MDDPILVANRLNHPAHRLRHVEIVVDYEHLPRGVPQREEEEGSAAPPIRTGAAATIGSRT